LPAAIAAALPSPIETIKAARILCAILYMLMLLLSRLREPLYMLVVIALVFLI
jgi:hypothetical protein